MQALTAPPRDALTEAQVLALLTSDEVTITPGLDLLDSTNMFVADLSVDFDGGSVSRNNFADVHGTCSLVILRELAWGKDRVRPFIVLDDGSVSARFNLGVYVLTTPDSARGDDIPSFTASGYDLLHLLLSGPGDTWVAAAGTTYLDAVQAVLVAAGIGVAALLDGTRQSTVLPESMVWALTPDQPASWLRIVNDLLDSIGYRGLWMNEDGIPRSGPYAAPSTLPVEWTFDTSDPGTDLLGADRTLTSDVWAAHNWWRFVRKGMATQPIEGNGIYTVTNASTGRTSVAALGRIVRAAVQFLDAPDQATLQAQGDQFIASEQAISRKFAVGVECLPIAGHFDVVQLNDAGDEDKCQATSWTLQMDGSPGPWVFESVDA